MFGKSVSQYLSFQKAVLGAVLAVGIARLTLSLAGAPDTTARWLSMNVVLLVGALWYGVAVESRGFGSYRQLLPLAFFQVAALQVVAVTGILLAIAGRPNIFGAPEFSGPFAPSNQGMHLLGHLTVGMVVPTLLGWGLASLVLRITRAFARRPAAA